MMRAFGCITVIITAATASSHGSDWQQQMKEQFSNETMDLYRDFLIHFQHQEMYPTQTAINSTTFPENRLYARSKSVELLHEYMVSATRELNADKLLEDPDYRDVECLGTFSGSNAVTESGESELTVMTKAVRDSIRDLSIEDLYKPDMMSHYAEIVPITESMMEGLKVWGPGHRGVVAKRNISAYTAIGTYYGDEYLWDEFTSQFSWSAYSNQSDHPFRKKWDYAMGIPYSNWADSRLNIPPGAFVLMDSFHEYDPMAYPLEGAQELTANEMWTKSQMIPNFVNDARESLYEPQLTEADQNRLNTEFVYCRVDGIIFPFVVVQKHLVAGQQLFVYYGPFYGN